MDARSVYKVDFQVTEDSSRIIRTLTLGPGSLTVSGFLQESGDTLHIEQIEVMDES